MESPLLAVLHTILGFSFGSGNGGEWSVCPVFRLACVSQGVPRGLSDADSKSESLGFFCICRSLT